MNTIKFEAAIVAIDNDDIYIEVSDPNNQANCDCLMYHGRLDRQVFIDNKILARQNLMFIMHTNKFEGNIFQADESLSSAVKITELKLLKLKGRFA